MIHERKIDCTLSPEDVSIRHLVLGITQSLVDDKVSITVDVLNSNGIRSLRVLADPLYEKAVTGTNAAVSGTIFDNFRSDVMANKLPAVSWVVAPEAYAGGLAP